MGELEKNLGTSREEQTELAAAARVELEGDLGTSRGERSELAAGARGEHARISGASKETTDVVALGELLIDFTPCGQPEQGQPLFERNPGGAPANVLAALTKLGLQTAFVGAVGEDAFGRYLADLLRNIGINVDGLQYTEEASTTLAFVHLDPGGDRSFTFCRKPGADQLLRTEQIDRKLVTDARIFHFGSVSMTDEPSRSATLEAAAWAKASGVAVSYDPNLRLPLWRDAEEAKSVILAGMALADIVKVSEEELLFLTGTAELDEGSKALMERFDMRLLLVTLGPDGSYCRARNADGAAVVTARHGGFPVAAVDTTGAGDAFLGGALYRLLSDDEGISSVATWPEEKLLRMLAFANAMGALTATGKGAIPSLPTLAQAEELAGK